MSDYISDKQQNANRVDLFDLADKTDQEIVEWAFVADSPEQTTKNIQIGTQLRETQEALRWLVKNQMKK